MRGRPGTTGHRGRFRQRTSPLVLFRRWSPGLFSPGSAGRWATHLGNVGLELYADRGGQRRGANVDYAMRGHARQVLVLDTQKGLLEVPLEAGPGVQDAAAIASREAPA